MESCDSRDSTYVLELSGNELRKSLLQGLLLAGGGKADRATKGRTGSLGKGVSNRRRRQEAATNLAGEGAKQRGGHGSGGGRRSESPKKFLGVHELIGLGT